MPANYYRNFCFTFNKYGVLDALDSLPCSYLIYGREVSKSGTPHLQGFVAFKSQKSLSAAIKTLQKVMPTCHVEVSRTFDEAIEYCKKDGDYVERGVRPMSQKTKGAVEEERWKNILEVARTGEFSQLPSVIQFKNKRLLEDHYHTALKCRKLEDTEMEHLWYYGSSGTGKSRKAREENPDAYLKMCNKWWDGYLDQEVVIIEDLDSIHHVLGHHLKIWADRYPFLAEVKGSAFKIRPKLIIVTTNYHPEEIWTDPRTLDPILRRFKTINFNQ